MNIIKKHVLLIFGMLLIVSALWAEPVRLPKIGYVDVERVFESYPGYEDIKTQLRDEKQKFEQQINQKKEEIAHLEMEYQNNFDHLTEEDRQRREAEIEYKKEIMSEFVDDANGKLKALRDELTKPLQLKIMMAIKKISEEKGYSMVFRKSSSLILHVDKNFDISDDIIIRLKKELQLEERN